MKFMLIIIDDEPAEAALPQAAIAQLVQRHTDFGRALRAEHKWVSSARLRYSREARTVRQRDETTIVVDGPFAESKEAIGGFYLIEAESRAEAIDWAKRLPLLESGGVEVRPARTGATWRGPIRAARHYMVLLVAHADRPQSRAQVFDAIDAHYELSLELAAQGKFVSSRSLEPSPAATAIRQRNDAPVVSDGPFAETKEFVAGYFVIACDSHDEAVEWGQRLMSGSHACEVRPLWNA